MTKSLIALLTLVAASPLAAQDFKKFDFMVGCWEGITGKDQVVQECWTPLADNMMFGMARYLTKRKATSYEFTAVEKGDSAVTWVSMPDVALIQRLHPAHHVAGSVRRQRPQGIGRLLQQIGFSPTPIREALLKLEQEGFVSRLQRGGFILSRFTKKDIEEIFEIRCLLESYAVSLAMNHIQPKDIRWLKKNVEESKQYVLKNKLAKVSTLNTEFHDYLNRLSKNDRLIFLINELKAGLPVSIRDPEGS